MGQALSVTSNQRTNSAAEAKALWRAACAYHFRRAHQVQPSRATRGACTFPSLLYSPLSSATAPPLPAPLKKTAKPSKAAFTHTARGDAAPSLAESHPYVHQIAEDLPADSPMEAEADFDVEDIRSNNELQELWPVGEIDPKRGRFPCCIVWTPLPVVSWLAPYIGHVGICQEDGSVLDFAGSNLVSMDNFAYGSVARYLQLDGKKCCFPANLAAHVCEWPYKHAELGTTTSWDGALQLGTRHFQHKYYNLFTCNCYSFVANCLNRLAYGGSVEWNVLNVAALVWMHGEWVDKMSIVRSFAPFVTVTCIGIFMAGWSFLIGISAFCSLLIGWFVFAVYCTKGLVC